VDQSISKAKIRNTTSGRDNPQPRNRSRHLPFPKAPNMMLAAKAANRGRRRITVQSPSEGIIPWGLPPFLNQEKKNSNSNTVQQAASSSAALPLYVRQLAATASTASIRERRQAAHRKKAGRRKKIAVTISKKAPCGQRIHGYTADADGRQWSKGEERFLDCAGQLLRRNEERRKKLADSARNDNAHWALWREIKQGGPVMAAFFAASRAMWEKKKGRPLGLPFFISIRCAVCACALTTDTMRQNPSK